MIYSRKLHREKDLPLVANWLANDSEHQKLGITVEDFFEPNTEAALIFDDDGPLMVFRVHKALRVAIQFNPETRLRSARVMEEVVNWMKQLAVEGKAKEVIIRPGGRAEKLSRRWFQDFVGKYVKVA